VPQTYQNMMKLERCAALKIKHFCRYCLYKLLAAGVHSLLVNYQSITIINLFNRSTAVPEKISF
jgi:hypothetical protein